MLMKETKCITIHVVFPFDARVTLKNLEKAENNVELHFCSSTDKSTGNYE